MFRLGRAPGGAGLCGEPHARAWQWLVRMRGLSDGRPVVEEVRGAREGESNGAWSFQ